MHFEKNMQMEADHGAKSKGRSGPQAVERQPHMPLQDLEIER
jgi:hypothetical protein